MEQEPPKFKKYVPKKYWYMLGWENYKIHLSNINELLKQNNIPFVSSGIFLHQALKINQELRIEHICDFNEFYHRKDVVMEEIVLPDKGHFSIQGNNLIADYLYNFLIENELI